MDSILVSWLMSVYCDHEQGFTAMINILYEREGLDLYLLYEYVVWFRREGERLQIFHVRYNVHRTVRLLSK